MIVTLDSSHLFSLEFHRDSPEYSTSARSSNLSRKFLELLLVLQCVHVCVCVFLHACFARNLGSPVSPFSLLQSDGSLVESTLDGLPTEW